MDVQMLDYLFLICQRASVEEQLAVIPANEIPDYDYLKTYRARHRPDINIAWSDAFVGTTAWLTDRDIESKEKQKTQSVPHSRGLGSL